ncbi:hypothetical protein AX14_012463 [Amanita brunnescens Koide BX004]|nr:hypothetical protein AX14_012463 [Amanita brunnescens Koide BX004]
MWNTTFDGDAIRSETRCFMSDRIPPRRTSSLKLTTRPAHVPIPPSLLTSPYLTSPESIFQREIATPCRPSEADERWLQDTVPLDVVEPVTGTVGGLEVRKEKTQFLRHRSNSHLYSRDCKCEHDDGWDRDSQSQLSSPELWLSPPSAAAQRLTGVVPTECAMSPSTSVLTGTISRRQSTDITTTKRPS